MSINRKIIVFWYIQFVYSLSQHALMAVNPSPTLSVRNAHPTLLIMQLHHRHPGVGVRFYLSYQRVVLQVVP